MSWCDSQGLTGAAHASPAAAAHPAAVAPTAVQAAAELPGAQDDDISSLTHVTPDRISRPYQGCLRGMAIKLQAPLACSASAVVFEGRIVTELDVLLCPPEEAIGGYAAGVVAVKVLRRQPAVVQHQHICDAAELSMAENLQNLPHVVDILSCGLAWGLPECLPCLVMVKYDCSLLSALRAGQKVDVQLQRSSVSELLFAVNGMHVKGILHRNINPSNIMLDGAQSAFVGGFGSACRFDDLPAVEALRDGGSKVVGTPLFVPPWVQSEGYSVSDDVWAVGVTLLDVLCGGRLSDLFPGGQRDLPVFVLKLRQFVNGTGDLDGLTTGESCGPNSVRSFIATCCRMRQGEVLLLPANAGMLLAHPWLQLC